MYDKRDIILVPFPYTDLTGSKRRPALIVSNDSFNSRSRDIVCCLITSNPNANFETIVITSIDMETGQLAYDSKIKPYRLFTISKDKIQKTLGKLGLTKYTDVEHYIKNLLP